MQNSWTRAWLASFAAIVLAVVVSRSREEWLLRVEKPVTDWLLDGTDTSIWDFAAAISSWWVILPGTAVLTLVALRLQPRVAGTIVITTALAYALTSFLSVLVNRVGPAADTTGTFPSFEVTRIAVFAGLVVLTAWWLGAPKIIWHIISELGLVAVILVAIRAVVSGEIWPTDAVGALLVAVLALITAAIVFETNPVSLRLGRKTTARSKSTSRFKKQSNEAASAA